ncbi:MAG: transposase, partial [Methanobacteriota archaeon]
MRALVHRRRTSVRRARELLDVPRRTYYYESRLRRPRPVDPRVRRAVRAVCKQRPSFGYRRVTAMLHREHELDVDEKRVRRVMKLEGLTLASGFSPPRKRVPLHPGRQITDKPDEAWQMDLKYIDCGRDGKAFLQSITDCCTGEWLGYTFSRSCGAREACEALERVVIERFPGAGRAPGTKLRVDNGTHYRAFRFVETAKVLGFDLEHIQIRTPEDNGCIESLHANLDRDYLNLEIFRDFDEADDHIRR